MTHAVDDHPRSHEHLAIFGLKPQRKIVKPKLLMKRKKVTELEQEAKKSKVEAMPSFGVTCEEDHQDPKMHDDQSIGIVNDELVETKSDNEIEMDKDEKPQELLSYLFVFQRVLDTTQARPSKRGLNSFKKVVTDVLFEEKSAYYERRGYYLDAKFKSNKDVIDIVKSQNIQR